MIIGTPGEESYIVNIFRQLDISELEGLEEWWLPLFSRIITILLSVISAVIILIKREQWILFIFIRSVCLLTNYFYKNPFKILSFQYHSLELHGIEKFPLQLRNIISC